MIGASMQCQLRVDKTTLTMGFVIDNQPDKRVYEFVFEPTYIASIIHTDILYVILQNTNTEQYVIAQYTVTDSKMEVVELKLSIKQILGIFITSEGKVLVMGGDEGEQLPYNILIEINGTHVHYLPLNFEDNVTCSIDQVYEISGCMYFTGKCFDNNRPCAFIGSLLFHKKYVSLGPHRIIGSFNRMEVDQAILLRDISDDGYLPIKLSYQGNLLMLPVLFLEALTLKWQYDPLMAHKVPVALN